MRPLNLNFVTCWITRASVGIRLYCFGADILTSKCYIVKKIKFQKNFEIDSVPLFLHNVEKKKYKGVNEKPSTGDRRMNNRMKRQLNVF